MFSELNDIICLLFEKLCALFYIEYILLHVQVPVQVQFFYSDHIIDGTMYMRFKTHNIQFNK